MPPFVPHGSIVRVIWGEADTILFAFAGSAAEFALNRAVDWLFFTGDLPRDPFGRLFSTARFAHDICFLDEAAALRVGDLFLAVHQPVERSLWATISAVDHPGGGIMRTSNLERAHRLHRSTPLI